jgi:hypothetical protein
MELVGRLQELENFLWKGPVESLQGLEKTRLKVRVEKSSRFWISLFENRAWRVLPGIF